MELGKELEEIEGKSNEANAKLIFSLNQDQ